MNDAWPSEPLGALLVRSEEQVVLQPDVSYKQVTVRLKGKGVAERGKVLGAEIAAESQYVVRTNQFIISRIDARNGASGLVPPELDGAVVTNDFPVFTVDQERLLPDYLKWLSKTAWFVELCKRASEGTTNRVRLKEVRFLALRIALPPLPEQRRIVARIEELAERITEAKHLRREADDEATTLARSLTDRAYREMCATYPTVPLAEASITITDGTHLTPEFGQSGVRFVFVGNVSTGHLHFSGCKYVTPEYYAALAASRQPKRGDLLYSAVGATLGVPAVVDVDVPFCFQRHVAIIRPNTQRFNSRFLWHMLRSESIYRRAWSNTTGSAQPTVPLGAIRRFPVPDLPLHQQIRQVVYLDRLCDQIGMLHGEQKKEEPLFDALLPSILDKAFHGEL